MLKIRKAQIQAFDRTFLQDPQKLAPLIQSVYPEQAAKLGSAGVKERLSKNMACARHYGLTQADMIKRFIQLMFQLNIDTLDDSSGLPWAMNILRWDDTSEELKIAALEKGAQTARIAELQKANN